MIKPENKEKKERTYKVNGANRKIYVRINNRSQVKVPLFLDNTKGKRIQAVYIGDDKLSPKKWTRKNATLRCADNQKHIELSCNMIYNKSCRRKENGFKQVYRGADRRT